VSISSRIGLAPDLRSERTAILLAGVWLAATLSWWGLAFPPLREAPPAWLARLQEVCFGSEADGVPKLYGWGSLVSGPAGFALLIWAGWGTEVRDGIVALWCRLLPRVLILASCAALLAQMAWAGWLTVAASRAVWNPYADAQSEPFPEAYPRLNLPLPEFRLVDREGISRTGADLQGRIVLLGFAYGHCTTVCPTTVAALQAAAHGIAELRPRVVIITLDAWRDTPSALSGLARKWGLDDDALLLSGNPVEVNRVLDEFRIERTRNGQTGEIDHVSTIYVVDSQGHIAYALNALGTEWLKSAARRAANTKAPFGGSAQPREKLKQSQAERIPSRNGA
jgi:protein SCO1/2